jgi:hypothetical protein
MRHTHLKIVDPCAANRVLRSPASTRGRGLVLTTLLLAGCAAHRHELDEPTPPEARGWCSLDEETAGRCVGERLKPEPVFVDPDPYPVSESVPLVADPLAVEVPITLSPVIPGRSIASERPLWILRR